MWTFHMELNPGSGLAAILAVIRIGVEIEVDLANVVADPAYLPVFQR